jgi:hypothetical protein
MKVIKKVIAVLYDLKDGVPYYLVLHRQLRWHGWELLKETKEDHETHLETLKRGIGEETGLTDFKIRGNLGHSFEWIWGDFRVLVEDVFLVKVDMTKPITLKQKVIEHDAYLWASKEEALQRLTYENTKHVLELVDRRFLSKR